MLLPSLLVEGKLRKPPEGGVPIDYIITWLKRRMPEYGGGKPESTADRVLVVQSETGSGKSTVLPVHVFRILRSERSPPGRQYRGPSVLSTQPRVLTAISLATDVAAASYYPDIVLGETVGYQTGAINQKPPSGLVYATIGVLMTQLRIMDDNQIMSLYRFIIVDEAHERSLDTDVTLMSLKHFYARNLGNPKLPFLILASATIDTAKYAQYFGVGDANIVQIEGRTHPIEDHWPASGTNDYLAKAADVAVEIHTSNTDDPPERADILIFAPGGAEIENIQGRLEKVNLEFRKPASETRPFLVIPITGPAVSEQTREYRQVFADPALLKIRGVADNPTNPKVEYDDRMVTPLRRIVISTNVAETGLTINTLKYVIDGGWNRQIEHYPPLGIAGLLTRPIARSNMEQRRGRAGRLFPGEFYPLYTKNVSRALDDKQLPNIVTEGCSAIFIDIVADQQIEKLSRHETPEFRVEDIDMLDVPPAADLAGALEHAIVLGFVSDEADLSGAAELREGLRLPADMAKGRVGYGLTRAGRIASRMGRVDMESARVLMSGYVWGVAMQDLVTIAALFGARKSDMYDTPKPPTFRSEDRSSGPAEAITFPLGAEALRGGLPGYLLKRVGGGTEDRPPSEAEAFYYRARLLISDDFIEQMLIYQSFARAARGSGADPVAMDGWCRDRNLVYLQYALITQRRDQIIEEMIIAGLNPFWGCEHRLVDVPEGQFLNQVARLKHCLYDGLRLNLLTYDAGKNVYRSRHGRAVKVPDAYTDIAAARLRGLGVAEYKKPAHLVTDRIRIAKRPAPGRAPNLLLYILRAGWTSVLDGYLPVDEEYMSLRKV